MLEYFKDTLKYYHSLQATYELIQIAKTIQWANFYTFMLINRNVYALSKRN